MKGGEEQRDENANFDSKLVMELSTFKMSGWNSLQPRNPNLLE